MFVDEIAPKIGLKFAKMFPIESIFTFLKAFSE